LEGLSALARDAPGEGRHERAAFATLFPRFGIPFMTPSRLTVLPLALVVFGLSGCGKPGVSGRVTFDGQPVDGGAITFVQEGGVNAQRVGGQINDGKYNISTEKMPPGKYKVEIVWNKKTGKQLPNPNDAGTMVDETKQVIPIKYNSNSELSAEIKSGANTADFELKPGGPVGTGAAESGKVKAVGD
jgi:hypothetical protein